MQTVCYSIVLKFYPLLLSPGLGEHNTAVADYRTAIGLTPHNANGY